MVGYWTGFAKYLHPGVSESAWPEFLPGSLNLVFVTPVGDTRTNTAPGADCGFWDGIGYGLSNSFWGLL